MVIVSLLLLVVARRGCLVVGDLFGKSDWRRGLGRPRSGNPRQEADQSGSGAAVFTFASCVFGALGTAFSAVAKRRLRGGRGRVRSVSALTR